MSECVSLMIGTVVSHYSMTSAYVGIPVSCAQAGNNGNMSSVLTN